MVGGFHFDIDIIDVLISLIQGCMNMGIDIIASY